MARPAPLPTRTATSSGGSGGSVGNQYWIGQDGNVWFRSATGGVKNMGAPTGSNNTSFTTAGGTQQAYRVGDWATANAPTPGAVPNMDGSGGPAPVPGGGGSGVEAQVFPDTTASRNATQTTIDSLDGILNNKLAENTAEFDSLMGGYATEDAANQVKFEGQVQGNEQTRENGQQASLLAAANGSRGLMSTLSSIGALGGTGKLLANRAVAAEANMDIGNVNKNFDKNATTLNDTFGELSRQSEDRKNKAKETKAKTDRATKYDVTKTRQDLYKDMAGLWSKGGNNAMADQWTGKGAGLTSELLANTRPVDIAGYAKTPLAYSAPALSNYLAGANDMTVNVAGGGGQLPINGALFTSTKDREKQLA